MNDQNGVNSLGESKGLFLVATTRSSTGLGSHVLVALNISYETNQLVG